MLLDTLEHAALYTPLHPLFPAAFAFLQRRDLATIAPGRHALNGDALYATVQDYATQPLADGLLEVHRRYLDIQCVLGGAELVGYAPLARQPVRAAYQADKDIAFLEGAADFFTLRPGLFAIFYPHDAHLPGRAVAGASSRVRKIVVKVALA
jgi:YhcH/YjgK/YiaL family protein